MNSSPRKAVLVCDTQPVAIEGVRGLLDKCDDLRFAGAVCSLQAAFELTRSMMPAVVVIDKALGLQAITDWLHQVNAAASGTKAVVWGVAINEAEALRLLQAGARGVLRRTSEPEVLLTCVRAVTSGSTWMEDTIFGDT